MYSSLGGCRFCRYSFFISYPPSILPSLLPSLPPRFPYGPVAIVAPFNFPLEIPLLQIMGALYMGNKVGREEGGEGGLVDIDFGT